MLFFDIFQTLIMPYIYETFIWFRHHMSTKDSMKKNTVFISEDLKQVEDRARNLIHGTLAQLPSVIDTVAMKMNHDPGFPKAAGSYHCTISLRMVGEATLHSEARDCDEMLAVYRALAKIVDQTRLTGMYDDKNRTNGALQKEAPFD